MRARQSKLMRELLKDRKFGRELLRTINKNNYEIYEEGIRKINDYEPVYHQGTGKWYRFKKM